MNHPRKHTDMTGISTPRDRQIEALKGYMLAAAIGIGLAAVMVFGWSA